MHITTGDRQRLISDITAALGGARLMLSVAEFAQLTGISEHTIRAMCASKELPAAQTQKGAPYRIHFTELAPYLTQHVA
ncbi:helix-turn-helix domain-containing protein [Corynebacterium pseudodiphtheriticum]|uniref:helix-turn-helix domain-containing protein n=1 Tax=Corynebacterium pseudodiphtheriticum TaxID=37637 RepID=UPI0025414078|nr:helix-turn-helix domain-containing protein [Corynebacterium pseudodiphtheriticum]MDK4286969.1 helix-turn-helix domain-containing protein [Corynebacterium pseudodiphtheriticum]MDK8500686.1 helix-turn-helix domain-containing protein [Corynebacterium pseudodiphtheriticum]MDK8775755.1 helix-turn-helix domain-containing protein [Corynebacterium pseudodiphtheriticum]